MERSKLKPILSQNLSIVKFDEHNYYVHQTKLDYRLKISTESYDLLLLANSENSLEDIKTKYNDEEITIDFLDDFYYKQLSKYGIIENPNIDVKPIGKPSYLKLSFIVLPSKVVDFFTPYLSFLFIPKLMLILLFSIFSFLSYILFKRFDIIASFDLQNINWIYFTFLGFISVTFHEFGHATSAKYFGAKHGGIGGGFYLFTPVYFADVSDIWKLSRLKRIIVSLSGVYFEAIISCLYIGFSLIIKNETLLIVGFFIFIHSLWNLNPFLRNDGYWVLSDALNYPNLSKNSLLLFKNYLKHLIKKEKFTYSFKNILIVLYAITNQLFIIIFLFYSIKNYGLGLLTFPYDFIVYIKSILNQEITFNIKGLANYFIPFLFYFLLFNLLKSVYITQLNRHLKTRNLISKKNN